MRGAVQEVQECVDRISALKQEVDLSQAMGERFVNESDHRMDDSLEILRALAETRTVIEQQIARLILRAKRTIKQYPQATGFVEIPHDIKYQLER